MNGVPPSPRLGGLGGAEGLKPAALPGGMRGGVGLARAVALQPSVIRDDKPTTGLDPANSRRIGALIKKLQRELEELDLDTLSPLDALLKLRELRGRPS